MLRPRTVWDRTALTDSKLTHSNAPSNPSGTVPISGARSLGLSGPVPRLVLAWTPSGARPIGDRLLFARSGDEAEVGRESNGWNQTALADPAMSRRQATLRREGRRLVLHNHGSTNPSTVHGGLGGGFAFRRPPRCRLRRPESAATRRLRSLFCSSPEAAGAAEDSAGFRGNSSQTYVATK